MYPTGSWYLPDDSEASAQHQAMRELLREFNAQANTSPANDLLRRIFPNSEHVPEVYRNATVPPQNALAKGIKGPLTP